MGLDITAYRRLKPCEKPAGADKGDFDYDRYFRVYRQQEFPGRDAGLVSDWYEIDLSDGGKAGFGAGHYSGYSAWREWLSTLAGYPPIPERVADGHAHSAGAWEADGGPFWELINFSDCEGTIGHVVSAKLARDFAEWEERARAAAYEPWFYDRYRNWRAAFELASDGGAVDFH